MRWLLTIGIILCCTLGMAQDTPKLVMDTSSTTVRALPETSLDSYRQNEEFHYAASQEQDLSLWDRFWRWFWRWVDSIFERKGVASGTRYVIYGVSLALIVYAVYKFSGMDRRNLFRAAGKEKIEFHEARENIYDMDLPSAIRQAETEGNYRLALRLQYLSSLRMLADKKLIVYTIHKTNHDYAKELAGSRYAASFSRVTLLYEFGWYGEFDVTADMYQRIRAIFDEHFQLLSA